MACALEHTEDEVEALRVSLPWYKPEAGKAVEFTSRAFAAGAYEVGLRLLLRVHRRGVIGAP